MVKEVFSLLVVMRGEGGRDPILAILQNKDKDAQQAKQL